MLIIILYLYDQNGFCPGWSIFNRKWPRSVSCTAFWCRYTPVVWAIVDYSRLYGVCGNKFSWSSSLHFISISQCYVRLNYFGRRLPAFFWFGVIRIGDLGRHEKKVSDIFWEQQDYSGLWFGNDVWMSVHQNAVKSLFRSFNPFFLLFKQIFSFILKKYSSSF